MAKSSSSELTLIDAAMNIGEYDAELAKNVAAANFMEIGDSGLKRVSGQVYEEFLQDLRGSRGIRVYREMTDNDSVVGASLFAFKQTLRKITWYVQPGGEGNLAAEAADHLRSCIDDMSHTFDSVISDICSQFSYGWAYFEVVYKRRRGESNNPRLNSHYNDNLIGWRKIALRRQSSFEEWDFDDTGGIRGMWQQPEFDSKLRYLPLSKCLLFRTESDGNNPEGRSILRNAYRSWYIKKTVEEIEAIGIERDLIGLPRIIPPENFSIDSPKNFPILIQIKKLISSLRRGEQDGIMLPPGWGIELLSAGRSTRRQFDTSDIITRYDKRIAVSMLTQAIMLGIDRVGSYALSENQVDDFFLTAAQGYLDNIAETFNRFEIPRLFRLNPKFLPLLQSNELPRLVPGKVREPNLKEIAAYISELAGNNLVIRDADLLADLRRIGGFAEPRDKRTRIVNTGEGSEKIDLDPHDTLDSIVQNNAFGNKESTTSNGSRTNRPSNSASNNFDDEENDEDDEDDEDDDVDE